MNFWQKKSKRKSFIPGWVRGAGIGALFILPGLYYEQFADFYRKAIMICLECIGIG